MLPLWDLVTSSLTLSQFPMTQRSVQLLGNPRTVTFVWNLSVWPWNVKTNSGCMLIWSSCVDSHVWRDRLEPHYWLRLDCPDWHITTDIHPSSTISTKVSNTWNEKAFSVFFFPTRKLSWRLDDHSSTVGHSKSLFFTSRSHNISQ